VVDHLFEVLDVAQMGAYYVAVVAGDSLALDDLRGSLRQLRDALELPRRGADADDRREHQAERARIDAGAVADHDALALEALQPLGDRRRGEADSAAELGKRQARVVLELGEQAQVGLVEQGAIGV
jgi:hypothetical protein